MAALITEFLTIVTALLTFVQDTLVPADVASITLIHVAIWTPVVIGFVGLVVNMLKGMWARRGKA